MKSVFDALMMGGMDPMVHQQVDPWGGIPQAMGQGIVPPSMSQTPPPQMGPPQPQGMPQQPMPGPQPPMPQQAPQPPQNPLEDVESALMAGMATPEMQAMSDFEEEVAPFEDEWARSQEQRFTGGLFGAGEKFYDMYKEKKLRGQRQDVDAQRAQLKEDAAIQQADQKYKDAKEIMSKKGENMDPDMIDAAARLYAQGEDLNKVMPDHLTLWQKEQLAQKEEDMAAQDRRAAVEQMMDMQQLGEDQKQSALKMHDRVAPTIKSYNKTQNTMQRLLNLEELYGENPAPAQINAMYDFIKSIDPDSVVREGEVRLTQEGQGYVTMLQNVIGKAKDDQVLPREFYDQIVNVAQSINYELQRGYAKELGNYYNLNEKHGMDQGLVFGGDSIIELARRGAEEDWSVKEPVPVGSSAKEEDEDEIPPGVTVRKL